jgi:chromosome segregation ATPase
MIGILTPSFHVYYLKQLNQLPHSIKIDIWQRLISQKYPLSLEQASSIHSKVERLLNQTVKNYIKKKERQRMKPITTKCENLLSQENEELRILKQEMEKKIEDLSDSQDQYKSREQAMTKSLEESGEKITQLSDSVAFFKSMIPDTKKAIASAEKSIDMLENKC